MLSILEKSHFEISGNDINFLQLLKKPAIFFTFLVFHFDISGQTNKFGQQPKKTSMFVTFSVLKLEISPNFCKLKHP